MATKHTFNGGKNALQAIDKHSPIAKINMHKASAATQIRQRAFTAEKDFDQEVVVLSTDDIFSANNAKKNLFGLQPALKAKHYDMLSAEPEIDDVLERMVDECIVYDSESNKFCFVETKQIDALGLNDNARQSLIDDFESCFDVIYGLYAFNGVNTEPSRQDIKQLLREYLVRGRLAWEVVYDDIENPTTIVGFKKLNAFALTPMRKGDIFFWEYDRNQSEQASMQNVWGSPANTNIVAGGSVGKTRLLDSQVVYLQWNDDGVGTMSYLERLVRAFNLLRIIERSRIAYATTASRFRTQITIPVKGKTKTQAYETLRKAMNKYHEKIDFDDNTGELKVNGQASVPFNSEIWFAETNSGKPSIQNLDPGMPDLSDTSAITYFRNNFQRLSKLPLSRFDEGGGTWNVSDESMQRDERRFAAFIAGIMHRFGVNVMLKPIWILMCLENNKYIGDNAILNALSIGYNKYNQYQVQLELNTLVKRVEAIQRLSQTLVRNIDMNETQKAFWSGDYLIDKYLSLPKSELDKNASMLARENAELVKLAMEQAAKLKQQQEAEEQLGLETGVGEHTADKPEEPTNFDDI